MSGPELKNCDTSRWMAKKLLLWNYLLPKTQQSFGLCQLGLKVMKRTDQGDLFYFVNVMFVLRNPSTYYKIPNRVVVEIFDPWKCWRKKWQHRVVLVSELRAESLSCISTVCHFLFLEMQSPMTIVIYSLTKVVNDISWLWTTGRIEKVSFIFLFPAHTALTFTQLSCCVLWHFPAANSV